MSVANGLDRMRSILKSLGNPEKGFQVLHIAGTNGKGSTAVFIASILEDAGYSVGLYTSPHLEIINERIQIWNGEHTMISDEKWDNLAGKVDSLDAEPTYFERITAIAYLYFAEENPDYVVLETGLGGRLDSTNTIEKPLVTVLTQIGMDHTDVLGRTIFRIIREKTGIIKPGVPVVSQSNTMMVQQIVSSVAAGNGSDFIDVSGVKSEFRKYELGMKGLYQVDNAATAVLAIRSAGIEVSEENVERGLKKAIIPGRFEIVSENPYWIIDGAHNPDAVRTALATFNLVRRTKKFKKTLVIFGCMSDKNYHLMIQLLSQSAVGCDMATVAVDDKRGEDPYALADIFRQRGRECTVYSSAEDAYKAATEGEYECVLTLGSIYLVGAMRKLIK